MSSDSLESLLFSLQSNAEFAARYRAEPGVILPQYLLSDAERRLLLDWDVRAIAELGVNSLLLMGAYQAVFGHAATPQYIRKMSATSDPASAAGK